MKKTFLAAKVGSLFIAAALLAACYAPLTNQKGSLSFSLSRVALSGNSQAVVFVVDSGDQAILAETLYLISKSQSAHGGLTASEADRLLTLGKELASAGLVKIGGYPFFLVTLPGSQTTGTFEIPGIPAGRDYFVKLFVLNSTVTSFSASNIDQNFNTLLQFENVFFSGEASYPAAAWTNWQNWTPINGQPVTVSAGQSVSITTTLVSPP